MKYVSNYSNSYKIDIDKLKLSENYEITYCGKYYI
jgi:hypothetical protein